MSALHLIASGYGFFNFPNVPPSSHGAASGNHAAPSL